MRYCTGCQKPKRDDEFYVSQRAKCKDCVKARVRENRTRNADYYRAYDRMRYREYEHRQEAAKKSSANYPEDKRRECIRRKREAEPQKYKARNAVNNALRDGRLVRSETCFFCQSSTRLQAHHPDYNRLLDVVWLCSSCHGKLHHLTGDLQRA